MKLAVLYEDVGGGIVTFVESKKRLPVVAVDFDGTLTKKDKWRGHDYIPEPRRGAREAMKTLRALGVRLIINTVRGKLKPVRAWLRRNGIPFDYVNENPDNPPDSSNKIAADIYVDDRAVDGRQAWHKLLRRIVGRLNRSKAA